MDPDAPLSDSHTRLAAGAVVTSADGAGYEILAQHGEGGFGVTWRGRRVTDDLAVILKELRVERLGDWKALELFEREARALAALDHPRIPTYRDFFAWDGTAALPANTLSERPDGERVPSLVLIQDFVTGRSLQQVIDQDGPMDPGSVEQLLRGLLDILEYLHGRQPPVVHRDVNPRNIIVGDDGAPWLVDFGAIQDTLRLDQAAGSTHVGTLGFMPVEQLMGKARPASDLYALGVTLLVLMTRTPPTRLPTDDETQAMRVDDIVPTAPVPLRVALTAMTQPHLSARVSTAAETLSILDGNLPAVVAVAAPPAPVGTGPPPRRRRNFTWLFNLVLATSCLAAAVLYFGFFSSFSETQLVQLSPFWVAPIAFGVSGLIAESNPNARSPLTTALLWAGVSAVGLIFFFEAIFPGL